ncbi:MAG: UbiA family prenyltransferase [Pseudomonadales bacterium]|nr:UbiA family prenyltransferase [Pseudomonadales bacterium]
MTVDTISGSSQVTTPLCVDLDGTLINTDLLLESFVRVLKESPWVLLFVPFWLLKGKHILKAELAARCHINIEKLPYNEALISHLSTQQNLGRQLILCTGSNIKFALQINQHLNLFDEVIASDDMRNLTGSTKVKELNERFSSGGYDYAGNEAIDLKIWKDARKALVINGSVSLKDKTEKLTEIDLFQEKPRVSLKLYLKAARIHQWVKNLLIFVPLGTAHIVNSTDAYMASILAFISFGLLASSTYIINDLTDLDSDRCHDKKRERPFASGAISIQRGILFSAGLLISGLSLTLVLPIEFGIVLMIYLITTLSYSLRLKSMASVDVITLALLYTVRVIAGAFAIGVTLSFWLLAFSLFIFLCLAIVKRVSELINMEKQNKDKAMGRGYEVADRSVLQSLGTSSGYMAVLVMALYINSTDVIKLYQTPEILWILCPILLYWITRVWMKTARGLMNEDPILFALKDKNSWMVGLLSGMAVVLATIL